MSKLAIITGTSKGIGYALADLMLTQGYNVHGISRTNKIVNENFIFSCVDLSNSEELMNLQLPNISKYSDVILVNNAGDIGEIMPLGKKNKNKIALEYVLNLTAPTVLCSNFIDLTQKNSSKNTIVNISSGAGYRPISSWSTYCASKSAINMLTDCINDESLNIKAFAISPGIVNTEMQEKIRKANANDFPLKENFINYFKDGELEDPKTIAKKILYVIQNQEKIDNLKLSLRDIEI